VISAAEERRLVEGMADWPFAPFDFHGHLANRRVVAFGMRYDYGRRAVAAAEPFPDLLLPLRDRAADMAGLEPADLDQVLINEYRPGAGIGWHRDKSVFGEVVGVSLLSPCILRFRRAVAGGGWERRTLTPQPRSAYVLTGPARTEWEHSIPPVETLRYSITFRRFLGG
jgi:alkylated DNA repair dioxygenase AlkB